MKRFLAWIVMVVLECIMVNIIVFLVNLVANIFGRIANLSELVFWVVIILGGATVIGFLFGAMWLGNGLVVTLSEKVCPSNRGTRYIVLGSIMLALYIFVLIAYFAGAVRNFNVLSQIAAIVNMVIFLICSRMTEK